MGSKPITKDIPPVADMEEDTEMEMMEASPLESITQMVDGLTPEDLTTLLAYINEKLNSQEGQPINEETEEIEEV